MITGIGCQVSQQMPNFLNSVASKFQGRIFSSFSNSLQIARIMEIAKLITILAVMTFAVVAAVVGIKWLLSSGHSPEGGNRKNQGSSNPQNLSQPFNSLQTSFNVQNDPSSILQMQTSISPFLLSPPKEDKKPLKTQGTSSTPSITSNSFASTLPSLTKMPISPIGPAKQFQAPPFAVQPFSLIPLQNQTHYLLLQNQTHYLLPFVKPQNVMNLMFDKRGTTLAVHFQQTIRAINSLEDQINLQAKTPFPNSISYCAFLYHNSDVLNSFSQGNVQPYVLAAKQLYDYLNSLNDFYKKSLSTPPSQVNDPILQALVKIHRNDLSKIFAALCETQFNQGNPTDCFTSAKKIRFNTDIRDSILTTLANNYSYQGNFDNALTVLNECSFCNAREHWKFYIARALFNQNNWDGKGLKVAEGMSSSDEKNEFILNIAKLHFSKGDLIQAYSIAEKASSSDERRQVYQAIAKAHFNNGNLVKAYDIASWLSGDDKKEIIQALAKAHFNSGNMDKAYDMAGWLPSDDKKEMIHTIAKKYILDGKTDKAKDMAGWLSGSEKTEILQACAETHYSLGNIKKMCEAVKYLPSSDEKQFFVNVVSALLHQGKLKEAEQVAKEMPYGKEQNAAYCDIALAHYRSGNHQVAISIANNMSYGKERDSIVEQMQKGAKI